jgi:hypothetical protein
MRRWSTDRCAGTEAEARIRQAMQGMPQHMGIDMRQGMDTFMVAADIPAG